ncbi:DUF1254 domain-containing protein [Ferrimonas marina]|nr:DUF1254 domain-containing protein [Ferrimonas marina]
MQMTTAIPEGITTPDNVDTRLGELSFFDGVPDPASAQKIYDFIDFQHAYQAYMSGIQIASMYAIRQGLLEFGPANTTAVQFADLMDSKALFLTANTTSVYQMAWLELTDEPMVIETPPDVLGIVDDHWFKYVADFGRLGPDQGQGGKFLILPPGYEGDVPEGYHVARTNTYGNWVIWRGFQVDGSTETAVKATQEKFKIYPLSQKANPPKMTFINVSGKEVNTIHRMDAAIFEEINAVVQAEPSMGESEEILGILASIGIKKGQKFEPDERMQGILSAAAQAGAVSVKTIMSRPRDEMFYFYPGESVWMNPFPGGSYQWLNEGAKLLDARAGFHYYATGITPAMAKKIIGKGSKYAYTFLDKEGYPLNGSETYRVHVPANVPAKDFWSFTLYDNQTRSMLQTDARFPGIDNNREGMVQNEDGSFDVYFGPEAPPGQENNWVQTIPGRGFNLIFRLYGPLEPWFDKTWRLADPELLP